MAAQDAEKRWHAGHSTLWLTALLTDADSSDGLNHDLNAALAAAQRVPADSPAYLNLQYQLLRLLAPAHPDQARAISTALLARADLTASERNRVLDQRLPLARDLEEFLAFAPQKPAIIGTDYRGFEAFMGDPFLNPPTPSPLALHAPVAPPLLPALAADALNRCLPNQALIAFVAGSHVPPTRRNDLLAVALTRALVLQSKPQAQQLRPLVAQALPQFTPLLDAFLHAASPEDRRFAAANLLLRLPGADFDVTPGVPRRSPVDHIQDYGGNWWCTNPQSTPSAPAPPPPASCPAFVTPPMLKETRKEHAALRPAQSAEAKLGPAILAFARSHPADPRIPETLHLLSRLSRFSCDGDYNQYGNNPPDHLNYSRAAFTLLHQRYPNSPWTRKTRYWYDKQNP